MTSDRDFGIRDLGQCKLALRSDLVWTPQLSCGQSYYMVEDRLNSKFYRVGRAEYSFVSLLDGETSIRDAVAQTAISDPNAAISEQEAATICHWLLDNRLILAGDDESPNAPESLGKKKAGSALQRWNPVTMRLPLLHPDRFFASLSSWFYWAFTAPALTVWLALFAVALLEIGTDWHRFLISFEGIFAPLNWLLLPLCWLSLKLIHELAHGLACRRYGGNVREAGVILILFMPMTYVDVTSSWRFRSKWHRLNTAAAGMYAELFFASVAALVWAHTGPGIVNSLCFNIIIMASVTTIAFNANFLMRFDGYYMLSDVLEIPNLSALAQQELSHFVRRLFFCAGPPPAARPRSAIKRWLVVGYGAASLVWKVLVCAGLIIAASTMFHGAGIIVAVLAAVLWLAVPLRRMASRILHLRKLEKESDSIAYSALGVLTIATLIFLTVTPWPGAPHTPVVVQYEALSVVRADSPGFLEAINVRGGQWVETGRILARLRNDQLQIELSDLTLSVRQSVIKIRAYEHERQLAAWQAEQKNLDSLRKKLQEKQDQINKLTIRAPSSGRVLGDELGNQVGVFVKPGDEILSIARERHKELKIAISQDDLPRFKQAVQKTLRVRLPGSAPFECRLLEITPRATTRCPHESLSAINGGCLAVKPAKDAPDELVNPADHELVAPRFVGTLELSQEQSLALCAGQNGTASLISYRESIGQFVCRKVQQWIRRKWNRSSPDQVTSAHRKSFRTNC